MATRATYTIEGISFYIHHDGYVEGAAAYFANALISEYDRPSNSSLAGDFCRANNSAEILVNGKLPEHHSDREYHYEVVFDTDAREYKITAIHIGFGDDEPEVIFTGGLLDFINTHNQIFGDSLVKFDRGYILGSKVRETASELKKELLMRDNNMSGWVREQKLEKLMQLSKHI